MRNYSSTNLYYNGIPIYDTDKLSGTYDATNLNNGQRSLRVNSLPILLGLNDLGSIFNHNHVKIQPDPNITFASLSGNLPNGAIYFQTLNEPKSTDYSTLTSDWKFNIERTNILSENANNKISKLTNQPDTYLLMVSGNSYNSNNYKNIYNIYKFLDNGIFDSTFSLPNLSGEIIKSENDSTVIPIVKNFNIYGTVNTKEYKLNS